MLSPCLSSGTVTVRYTIIALVGLKRPVRGGRKICVLELVDSIHVAAFAFAAAAAAATIIVSVPPAFLSLLVLIFLMLIN